MAGRCFCTGKCRAVWLRINRWSPDQITVGIGRSTLMRSGTKFVNDRTGHGMFVSIENVYAHSEQPAQRSLRSISSSL